MSALEKKKIQSHLRFGEFTLDMERRGLFRDGERIHLTSKPLETLIFLVENRGRTVGKQELLDAVWTDTFVTEDVLVQAIREIRRVLGDDKDNPRFIQTVPRQGYRFVGAVSIEFPFVKQEQTEAFPLTIVTKQKSLSWLWISLVIFVIGCLIAVAVWFVRNRSTAQGQSESANSKQQTSLTPMNFKQITTGEFNNGKPAFSPDGKFILYVGSSEETRGYSNIFVMPTNGGNSLPITEKANPSGDMPVFTADGSQIVFSRFRDGKDGSRLPDLWVVPSFGGAMKMFIPEAFGAGFSPDGKWVAYTKQLSSHKTLWLSSLDNLQEHSEISTEAFTPRWSPDGKWIAYTTSYTEGGEGDIWIVDTKTLSEHRNLTRERQQLYGLTWTADSQSIIFASRRTGPMLLWQININNGKIEPITYGVGDYLAPSASPDGKTLICSQIYRTKNLFLAEGIKERELKELTFGEFHLLPRISPTGKHVATVMQRPDFNERLSILEIETGKSFQSSDTHVIHHCWLDDVNVAYLLYDASVQATIVRVWNIVTNATYSLAQFAGNASWLAIHPSKRKVAVVQVSSDGTQKILIRDLDTQLDELLAEGGVYESMRWSPDGLSLSWSGEIKSSNQASNGVWLIGLGEKQARRIANDGYGPVWSADGSKIYFTKIHGQDGFWQYDVKKQSETKVRNWKEVSSFDLIDDRLIFLQGSGQYQIYSLILSQ